MANEMVDTAMNEGVEGVAEAAADELMDSEEASVMGNVLRPAKQVIDQAKSGDMAGAALSATEAAAEELGVDEQREEL